MATSARGLGRLTGGLRRGIAAVLILLAAGTTTPASEPGPQKIDLFTAGEGGYRLYRIPGLIVTARGTLLAYCEARRHTGLDWDQIEILVRRSTDGGRNWSGPQALPHPEGKLDRNPVAIANAELARRAPVADNGGIAFNNPVAIADPDGPVHFLYCVDYFRCFYLRSDDDGLTFGKPVEITSAVRSRRDYDARIIAIGPGHGVRLRSGRLVVPVWLSTGTGSNAHHPSVVSTLSSDDGGATWRRGDIVAGADGPLTDPSESALVELADGRVMINMRSESKANRRAVAISPDGTTHWTRPTFDEALVEPICMASLCRLSGAGRGGRDRGGRDRLLFSNPANLNRGGRPGAPGRGRDRKNLTVRLSYDEGKTWPVARVLEPGTSAYSDLAVGGDGTIYCLYERGSVDGKDHFATRALTLARFDLEWLSDGKDSLGPSRR